ncbi:MAG: SpoIIE family protein phosphatase [Solobacterium sp.]|nr:SpoIIE family protein phosphatase [Solobacterium sp.]
MTDLLANALMIVQMSGVTLFCVLLTYLLRKKLKDRKITAAGKISIGLIYGVFCILSTHFGVNYGNMILNARDLGPMSAGLLFDPVSGVIAGLIGGAERYIAGTYWQIGAFSTVACSISTCFAGFFAAAMHIIIFKRKDPSPEHAFFMGAVIEVFHMYAVFATHRNEMSKAFLTVKYCAIPMILFSGIGLFLTVILLEHSQGIKYRPLRKMPEREVPVLRQFRVWLFGITAVVLIVNFGLSYSLQTLTATQAAERELRDAENDISTTYEMLSSRAGPVDKLVTHISNNGRFTIFDPDDNVIAGYAPDEENLEFLREIRRTNEEGTTFRAAYLSTGWLCRTRTLADGAKLIIMMPEMLVYQARDIQAYETLLADVLLFSVIYLLISLLVQGTIVNNLIKVNDSLNRITDGDLNEKVSVYTSREFASLSDDINKTVNSLKGYIAAVEKNMEQELMLAKTIQDSALPKNFDYNNPAFEIYAFVDPAREVGGDFYDFTFVGRDRLGLVIADVSGKGIPAALFMMHSKTALRGLAETGLTLTEVFERVNAELCKGNDASMFVTVWMGVINLRTGTMQCVNAGHEYPTIRHGDGGYEIFKEKHSLPLGTMEGLKFKEYEITLAPGDSVFVYTDGVPEANNRQGEQYGTDRMLAALNANLDKSTQDLLPAVKADLDSFVGTADQFDDITMLGFRYNGFPEKRSA